MGVLGLALADAEPVLHHPEGVVLEEDAVEGLGERRERFGCGDLGGRYDGLTESVGGGPTPASGFAASLTSLAELVANGGDA